MNSRQKNTNISSKNSQSLLVEKEQVIIQQSAIINEKDQIIGNKTDIIENQKKRIKFLEEYLRLERARHYGRSSEKNTDQVEMVFNEAEEIEDKTTAEEKETNTKSKKKGGRKGLSKSLPRHQVYLNLSDEEKAGASETFYTKVKEELDIEPAKAQVIEYMQEKAVFTEEGKRKIKAAPLKKHILNKCIASISLLAYVVVSKYCDGLPLYRLENILKRYGGEITRTSMANWVIRLSLQLQPLINLMREHQISYDYIHADETRISVLKEPDKPPTSDKWMWNSRGGPPESPVILFDYDPSRCKEVPLRLFEGFQGYFQTDGYAGYDELCKKEGITQLGCWDHARRKFVDAQKSADPKAKRDLKTVAKYEVALSKIRKLYRIETAIKELSIEEKYKQRQENSLPILKDLRSWLEKNVVKVCKDSKTYTAINYTLNQWLKLIRYCEDGRLNISNAPAENAIRPFVIGRKAWLFADTPKGAHASAIHYSLIETAKANGLEPYKYLVEVFKRLPYAEKVEDFEALLPWNIKK